MAKKFFYACGAMLLLVVTFEVGARSAHGQTGQFRMLSTTTALVGDKVYRLDDSNQPIGWRELPYLTFNLPPVPPASLVTWEGSFAVTDDGLGWMRRNGVWESYQLPGVTAVENTTWGEVKARYRR